MDEKEQTAQTNDEEVEVGEVAAPDGEELQDESEFTEEEGAKETEVAEPSTEEEEESGQDTEEPKSAADNAKWAEARRKWDEKEQLIRERIRKDSYREGLLDAVGKVNPYTGEKIEDELDVQEFLTMRDIEKKGGDPLSDYRKAVKEKGRKNSESKGQGENSEAFASFVQEHPDIDVDKLLHDPKFCKFAGKRVAHEDLQDIYNDYLTFTSDIDAKVEKKADAKAKNALAKAKASPGSLSGNGVPATVSYTDMSEEEFNRKLKAVLRGEEKI